MENASAESITDAILKKLSECNLDVKNLRGQGYDGASVMSGKVSGVSSQIMQIQPRAMYHHCQAHNLNLVISSSCKQVPEIRNLFDSITALTWFLGASPKRKVILQRYLKSEDISDLFTLEQEESNQLELESDSDQLEPEGDGNQFEPDSSDELADSVGVHSDTQLTDDESQKEWDDNSNQYIHDARNKQIPKLCETRWSARLSTLCSIITKYKSVYLTLEDIASESSNADVRNNALSYTRLLQSSSFIVSLIVVQFVLSFTNPLCLALQKVDCDIVKAYNCAKLCKTTINNQHKV